MQIPHQEVSKTGANTSKRAAAAQHHAQSSPSYSLAPSLAKSTNLTPLMLGTFRSPNAVLTVNTLPQHSSKTIFNAQGRVKDVMKKKRIACMEGRRGKLVTGRRDQGALASSGGGASSS
eukprot:151660-Pleurochrysis_carterae.AAC.1